MNPDMTVSNQVSLSSQVQPYQPEENPFAEYMWMENEEEFNQQVRRKWAPMHRTHEGVDGSTAGQWNLKWLRVTNNGCGQ